MDFSENSDLSTYKTNKSKPADINLDIFAMPNEKFEQVNCDDSFNRLLEKQNIQCNNSIFDLPTTNGNGNTNNNNQTTNGNQTTVTPPPSDNGQMYYFTIFLTLIIILIFIFLILARYFDKREALITYAVAAIGIIYVLFTSWRLLVIRTR